MASVAWQRINNHPEAPAVIVTDHEGEPFESVEVSFGSRIFVHSLHRKLDVPSNVGLYGVRQLLPHLETES